MRAGDAEPGGPFGHLFDWDRLQFAGARSRSIALRCAIVTSHASVFAVSGKSG